MIKIIRNLLIKLFGKEFVSNKSLNRLSKIIITLIILNALMIILSTCILIWASSQPHMPGLAELIDKDKLARLLFALTLNNFILLLLGNIIKSLNRYN